MNVRPALRFSAVAIVVGFLLHAVAAPAAVILGNLPPPDDNYSSGITSTQQKAVAFTVGDEAIDITDVVLRLYNYNTTGGDVAQVGFFSDNGLGTNTTGSAIGGFLTAPASSSDALNSFTFTPSGTLTLAANTTYWMVVDVGAGDYVWAGNSLATLPTSPDSLVSFVNYENSNSNGSSYGVSGLIDNFQIDGAISSAPEPSRAVLLLLGTLMGLARRRRQIRS